jgi:hypothetical protein
MSREVPCNFDWRRWAATTPSIEMSKVTVVRTTRTGRRTCLKQLKKLEVIVTDGKVV